MKNNIQTFFPFIIFNGDDNYEGLHQLRTKNLTPFSGESSEHSDIFSIFQFIIDENKENNVFLNGDWIFLSAMLAHQGPSAFYPCPICTVQRHQLLVEQPYRTGENENNLQSLKCPETHTPFIKIQSDHIVPTPLHLFLGINNRIIFHAFKEIIGESEVLKIVKKIKSKHSAGCGGLSDVKTLNGMEIAKFLKRDCCSEIKTIATGAENLQPHSIENLEKLSVWMHKFQNYLLHSNNWTPAQLVEFRNFLDEVYINWNKTTHDHPFPKLHMLRHAVEFAEKYKILGAASEAQIESFHSKFNFLYQVTHRNMSQNEPERIRRSLADVVGAAIAPFAQQEAKKQNKTPFTRSQANQTQ